MTAFNVPQELQDDLLNGRRPLTAQQVDGLAKLLKEVEAPFPELFDLKGTEEANRLWESDFVQCYIGQESVDHFPGNIIPGLAWIIGQAEPDGPIALDFRVCPPRVVYLGIVDNESFWLQLADSYEALIAAITPPTTASSTN